jgi:hypothetical protein
MIMMMIMVVDGDDSEAGFANEILGYFGGYSLTNRQSTAGSQKAFAFPLRSGLRIPIRLDSRINCNCNFQSRLTATIARQFWRHDDVRFRSISCAEAT